MPLRIKEIGKLLRSRISLWRNWASFHTTWEYVGFLQYLWKQVFPYFKKNIYFPYDKSSTVCGNILVGKNCKVTQRGGCYIQGWGRVFIGDYVEITQNCIIISANHSLTNQDAHISKETIIGDHCWIASNVFINAGVILGPRTIVAAGSVVTKNFPDGFVLIGGNPAKVIKEIPREEFVPKHQPFEMYGYIPAKKFPVFKQRNLIGNRLLFHYDLSLVTSNRDLIEGFIAEDEQFHRN